MKVRMKGEISGARNGKPWPPRGEVIEVGDAEGASLCATGMAEPVSDTESDVERAVAPEAEKRAEKPASTPLTTDNGPTKRAATKAADK